MIELIIVLAALAAYLAIGWCLFAPRFVTWFVEHERREWPTLASDEREVESWQNMGAVLGLVLGCVWPLVLLIRTAGGRLIGAVKRAAPLSSRELAQQVAARDRRIAQLERQLGIGD